MKPQMNDMQRSPISKQQFYGIINPGFRQSPPTMFTQQQQQQQPIASSSSSIQQQQQQILNVVGPSDHYGIHHQLNNNVYTDNHSSGRKVYDAYDKNLSKSAKPFINSHSPSTPNQEETKVCVIVDSRTPVLFKIPLPPAKITLAHLKQALPAIDQPNYKYFFKSNDSEFGIVKEEIQDDDSRLPTYRDRVVAWIVTPGRISAELTSKTKSETDTCNLTYSNTSYDDGSSSLITTDIESTSYFTDDDSVSCSNYSETTCDTFISQRRNRHYKNGEKFPAHHCRDHQSNSPYHYNGHHNQGRNFDVSSSSPTSSSESFSDATAVHCLTVHLILTKENFLGLHVYGKVTNGVEEGIYVEEVGENSAVALDGRIESGDKLIQVNDYNLEELSNEEAVRVLKEAVIKRGPLKLVVAKFVENSKDEPLEGIVNPKEAIHPIDTAAWVAHAQAITILNNQEQVNSATSSPSFGSNAQDTDCIRPASAGIARLNSGLRLSRGITDVKEIIQHMKLPDVGLEIKDREWLKINIPKAFLGSNLVTWLRRNVYGFNSNRDAEKFASKMLKEGYIRDPISKKSFSSRSYYTFVI